MREKYDKLPRQTVPIKLYYMGDDGKLHVRTHHHYVCGHAPNSPEDIKYRIHMGAHAALYKAHQMERIVAGRLLTFSATPEQALALFREKANAELKTAEAILHKTKTFRDSVMQASPDNCITDTPIDSPSDTKNEGIP